MLRFLGKSALFLLLLMVVLEFVTRSFLPQQLVIYDDFFGPNSNGLGRFPLPNLDMIVNTGERDVRLITDYRGFRIGSSPREVNPDKRILLLGDSYVMAIQVAYEQSMGGVLESRFQDTGLDVVVDTVGSATFDLNHYKIVTEQLIGSTQYDLVFVLLNHSNDLVESRIDFFDPIATRTRVLRFPRNLTSSELVDAVLYPVNDWLERNSHLFILLKLQSQTVLARLGLTAYHFPWTFEVKNEFNSAWEISAQRMMEISEIGSEHGFPIVFILVPTDQQVDPAWLNFYVTSFDLKLAEVDLHQPNSRLATLVGENVNLVDPLDRYLQAYTQGVRPYGEVDSHFSPEGHSLMADVLFEVAGSYFEQK